MNGLAASIGELKAIIASAQGVAKADLMVCPPATLIASFAAAARGTPVLIVDGRYQTGGGQAGSLKNVMPTVDGLVNLARERRKKI